MAKYSGISKTKQKVAEVFNQAKESFKVLETLEKETFAKAKSFIKMPNAKERKRLTNDRILHSLKKLGVATHSEIAALEKKIQSLEMELSSQKESHNELKHPKEHSRSHSVETH